ncbi:MAG: efflux RND transporter periplasmic adaptor subunit [Xanthobacteraceae bacterium]
MGFLTRTTGRLTARRAARHRHGPSTWTVAVGSILAGCLLAAAARAEEPKQVEGMAVSVVKAKQDCFSDTIRVTGTVVPMQAYQVRAAVEGPRVEEILVEAGDSVSVGQPLARLSPIQGMNLPESSLTVTAPVAGTVGRIMTQVGAMVSMAAPPLFLIIIGGEYDLMAQIPSTRIGKIAVGQAAKVDVIGVGEFTGTVRTVSPAVDIATQTGQARISLGVDKRLKMGTFGRATIEVGTSCGVSVPLSAVLYSPAGPVIQVVRNNRVQTRPVPIGLLSGGNVEIPQGLREGDLVVRRAGTFLREGDPVRPFIEDEGPVSE